jgi:hypothetical protein
MEAVEPIFGHIPERALLSLNGAIDRMTIKLAVPTKVPEFAAVDPIPDCSSRFSILPIADMG